MSNWFKELGLWVTKSFCIRRLFPVFPSKDCFLENWTYIDSQWILPSGEEFSNSYEYKLWCFILGKQNKINTVILTKQKHNVYIQIFLSLYFQNY